MRPEKVNRIIDKLFQIAIEDDIRLTKRQWIDIHRALIKKLKSTDEIFNNKIPKTIEEVKKEFYYISDRWNCASRINYILNALNQFGKIK